MLLGGNRKRANAGPGSSGIGRQALDAARAVLEFKPFASDAACAAARKQWEWVSRKSGTALDTPRELDLMKRYFGGRGGAYQMSPDEWRGVVDYYQRYHPMTRGPHPLPGGGYAQEMNFARDHGDRRFDALLGTATGYFDRGGHLVGLRDQFDFDPAPRGNGAQGWLGGQAVGRVQWDADTFCPAGPRPVSITGGKVPR